MSAAFKSRGARCAFVAAPACKSWPTSPYTPKVLPPPTSSVPCGRAWPRTRSPNGCTTTLTDLRQQLHPLAHEVIIRREDRYQLNPDTIDTDIRRLRRTITATATAMTAEQQQTAVQHIASAHHGELAAGFSWPWLHPAREALRRDVIDAYLHVAASAPAAQAVDLVRAAADVDPYNENLHQHAARILSATGEHAAAETLLRTHRQRLIAAGLHPATADAPTRSPGL